MEQPEQSNKANIAKTLIVYLGGAWAIIEAINFIIDKYRLNSGILDILILLVLFGLPATIIYTWFHQKYTTRAIILQAINGIIALAVIVFTLVDQADKAMEWLEKGSEVRDPNMPYIATRAYLFETLFDNPRFIAILEKMHLPLPEK